jgi:two-component system, sensor histidine kinase LadS
MLQKARLRVFFGVLLCAFFGAGHAQVFDRLYPDSLSIVLAQPLEWVAVPKDSVASPDAFTTADTGAAPKPAFQPYTDDTILPTSACRARSSTR